MATVDGKYKISIAIEYELFGTGTEVVMKLPAREINKRTKQLKRLTRHLLRLKKRGWDIQNIEVTTE